MVGAGFGASRKEKSLDVGKLAGMGIRIRKGRTVHSECVSAFSNVFSVVAVDVKNDHDTQGSYRGV